MTPDELAAAILVALREVQTLDSLPIELPQAVHVERPRSRDHGDYATNVALQLASLFPLVYMCLCSTYSVFQLKLFGMMDLAGHQNTDPYSLLVCASLFNRLQFSLAFNYLNVLMHSTNRDDFPPTAFQASIGARMDLSLVE